MCVFAGVAASASAGAYVYVQVWMQMQVWVDVRRCEEGCEGVRRGAKDPNS